MMLALDMSISGQAPVSELAVSELGLGMLMGNRAPSLGRVARATSATPLYMITVASGVEEWAPHTKLASGGNGG
jgi:hypothetical protein